MYAVLYSWWDDYLLIAGSVAVILLTAIAIAVLTDFILRK